jgi:hypothetical protein
MYDYITLTEDEVRTLACHPPALRHLAHEIDMDIDIEEDIDKRRELFSRGEQLRNAAARIEADF